MNPPRTVPELIRAHATAAPERCALVTWDGGARTALTYAELDAATDRIAAGLRSEGIAAGDRICLGFDNADGGSFYRLVFGAYKAGVVPVPLNTRLAPPEVAHIVGDSGARRLYGSDEFVAGIADADLAGCVALGDGAVDALADSSGDTPDPPALDDPADILYTSGTTGLPKGSAFRHRSLAINAANLATSLRLGPDDTFQTPAPVYTSTGTHTCPLPVLGAGATYVLEPGFDVDAAVARLVDEQTTVFFGVPAMMMLLLERLPGDQQLPALRSLMYGGSPIAEQLVEALLARFPGVGCWNLYGLTEGGPTGCVLPPENAIDHPDSVGLPVHGTEMKIVDDDGRELPDGEPGEIVMRAETLMDCYHNAPEPTAAALVDGWLHTGDIGKRDADGFYYLLDRKKDLIIRGGFNVYPAEIEAVLNAHPDIREVAVVAVPHRVLGEEPCAVVGLHAGATTTQSDLEEYTAARLADFKRPRRWRFVDALPRNAMGKILKRELRDELRKEMV
jgi:acyl-CoA synthetase (AMP-forming)/AMP-acid ligase II